MFVEALTFCGCPGMSQGSGGGCRCWRDNCFVVIIYLFIFMFCVIHVSTQMESVVHIHS